MKEKESLSWLTPTATDIQRTPEGIQKRIEYRESIGRKYVEGSLTEQVMNKQKFPTPNTSDYKGEKLESWEKRAERKKKEGINLHLALRHAVQKYPTPTARDYHTPRLPEAIKKTGRNPLTNTLGDAVQHIEQKTYKETGCLNPYWVEALMGLPQGWTALDGTETKMQGTWDNDSWEEGIPRVIQDCPNRIDRIRLCGNGVVPQTACIAWRILSGETKNQDS